MSECYSFVVNGVPCSTEEEKPLLRYLRDELRLTSVKDGCSEGACGTCTILVDGKAVKACILSTKRAAGKEIVTVEGLSEAEREAFVYAFGAVGAVQCGFCIPGMVIAGKALLDQNPNPTEAEIEKGHPGQRVPLHRLQENHRGHRPGRGHPPRGAGRRPRPGARGRLRRGGAGLPHRRAGQGTGHRGVLRRSVPGRHGARLRRPLPVPPGQGAGHRRLRRPGPARGAGRPHRRRRAPQQGGPSPAGLGRDDRQGGHHPLRGGRHLPGGGGK